LTDDTMHIHQRRVAQSDYHCLKKLEIAEDYPSKSKTCEGGGPTVFSVVYN